MSRASGRSTDRRYFDEFVPDPRFDLANHVRHEALPEPATGATARAAVARILGRPLDRDRPLW